MGLEHRNETEQCAPEKGISALIISNPAENVKVLLKQVLTHLYVKVMLCPSSGTDQFGIIHSLKCKVAKLLQNATKKL